MVVEAIGSNTMKTGFFLEPVVGYNDTSCKI